MQDRVRNLDIKRELGVESLLLRVKRSHLWWFGHLTGMPPGCIPSEVFWEQPARRRLYGRPRMHWRDYTSHLAWLCFGISQEKLGSIAGERGLGLEYPTEPAATSTQHRKS